MADILVVDDHPVNRGFLVSLLRSQKHNLFEAKDGAEALAVARAKRPDLVITDILMPTMDGYEFVRQLRADPAIGGTIVIFFTGHYHTQDAQVLARRCGVQHILTKPCEPDIILQIVEQSLAARPSVIGAPIAADFEREHLRIIADKLSQTADELQISNQRLSALVDINLQLASERDPERLLQYVCGVARDLFAARYAMLAVVHQASENAVFSVTSGMDAATAAALGPVNLRDGLLATAALRRESRRLKDVDVDPQTIGLPSNYPPVQALLLAPIVSLAHNYGWLCLTDKVGADEFSAEDERLLAIMSAQVGRIYENGRLFAEVCLHAEQLEVEVGQRKGAQEALAESESRFRQLAENIRDTFFLIDVDTGGMLYISSAYEEIWGRTCASLYADPKSWMQAIHPDDIESTMSSFKDGMEGGNFDYEFRIARPDGAIRWVHNSGYPVRDVSGEIVRYTGTCKDITERKHAAQQLRESERRFSSLLDNVEMISVMLDPGGCITYVNDYLLRITGWQRHEVMAQNWFELFVPQDRTATDASFAALLADDPAGMHHHNQIITRTGARRLIEWTSTVLRSAAGEVIGTASLGDDITERKAATDRITHLNRVYAMLSGINGLIVRVRDRDELFKEACRIAVEKGGFPMAWIGIVDTVKAEIGVMASAGIGDELLQTIKNLLGSSEGGLGGNTLAAQAVRQKSAVVSNDIASDPRVVTSTELLGARVRSTALLPLMIADRAVGVLALFAGEAEFFHADELKLLVELAEYIAFAIDYIDKQERLDYLAYYDVLTGLANQSLFHNRLSHSLHARGDEPRLIAAVLLDIERFRQVNETLGRNCGDDLLRDIGARLLAANDSTARVGADTFGLILRGARTAAEVNRTLEAIMEACFTDLFKVGGEEVRVACRAGVSLYPEDGANADTLLKNAEAALRRSKGSGDRTVFYAPEMNARVAEALAIETRLRRAVERREFVLHYQPKIALASGRITGVEALIRWQDPDHKLIPPNLFIPVLEETGMIVEVGRWVVEQAFLDLRAWSARGIVVPRVAVNVSAIQLHGKHFVETMIEEIRRGGAPEWLELEVTESIVMSDVEACTRKLSVLRAMGVTIAIDDFGTGYSSLSYLGRLPLDALKIDRSFVSGLTISSESASIVSTIITLAHSLRLKVVAEGVETEEQASTLKLLRCDEGQGYLYARPVPAAAMEALLSAGLRSKPSAPVAMR